MAKKKEVEGEIPPISEACQKAIDEFIPIAQRSWASDISAGNVWDRDTGASRISGYYTAISGYCCHAYILRQPDGCIVFNTFKDINPGVEEDFLHFLTTGTPFSHAILNRDNFEQVKSSGWVIDTARCGVGGALWLCKAARYLYEDTWRPPYWKKLVDAGFHPMAALVITSVHNLMGAGESYAGHCSVFTYPTGDEFKKIMSFVGKDHKHVETTCTTAFGQSGKSVVNYDRDAQDKAWLKPGKGKTVKVPDGWGGFVEKQEGGSLDDLLKTVNKLWKNEEN